MKKIISLFVFSVSLLGTWDQALAQSYNNYYPSNVSNNYGYQQHRKRVRKGADFKMFSLGFDYVIGETSMVSQKFSLESPLLGGETYDGSTDNFDDSFDSLNFNLGFRPLRYLGFEAFYQRSLEDNQVKYQEHYSGDARFAQAEYNVKYQAFGLDVIGYIPLYSRLELLASVGYAQYDFDADVDLNAYKNDSLNKTRANSLSMSDNVSALRYGGGLQLWLSQRLTFRAMYRYVDLGGDYFDEIKELSLGVRYNF